MSPRPDVSEERKNQILDAAAAVFSRLGFHEARMDDIVRESGLSKGTLYWYFTSKDAIITGLMQRIFDLGMAGLRRLEGADGPVRERLLDYTRRLGDDFQRLSAVQSIAFEFYAVAARHKTVRQFLKEYFKQYRATVARLIAQGIDRGEFRPVDPDTVATTLAALYEGLVLLWFVDREAIQWETQGTESVRLLLDGLRP
ncbi:MAG TPA: TetR/AcrR family transcriptional regulator [Chloroflexia bacterium]|nr:TetR/AcrR family transcriptional regulator [Chloroflexia bacterium]